MWLQAGAIGSHIAAIRVYMAFTFREELGKPNDMEYATCFTLTRQMDLVVDHLAELKGPRKLAPAEHVGNWQYRATGVDSP